MREYTKQEQRKHLTRLIEVLESDRYTQGFGQLYIKTPVECYCVEGVLCEVYGEDNPGCKWKGRVYYIPGEGTQGAYVDTFIYDYFGIAFDENLISMNDNDMKTFPEIAQYLREKYLDPVTA